MNKNNAAGTGGIRACMRAGGNALRALTGGEKGPRSRTVLHPQWLFAHNNEIALRSAAEFVRGSVLDVGCGSKPWEALFPHADSYMGIDYLGPSAAGPPKCVNVCGAAEHLPFADESFDTLISTQCLEHTQDPEAAVREMYRVLRPGGHVVVTTPFGYRVHDDVHDFRRWTAVGLKALFNDASLSPISVEPVGGLYATLVVAGHMRVYYEMGEVTADASAFQRVMAKAWSVVARPLCLPVFALNNIFGAVCQSVASHTMATPNNFPASYILVAIKQTD